MLIDNPLELHCYFEINIARSPYIRITRNHIRTFLEIHIKLSRKGKNECYK